MMQGGGRQGEGDSLCLGSLLVAVMEARARPGWSQESGAPIGQLASPSDFLVAASGSWTGTVPTRTLVPAAKSKIRCGYLVSDLLLWCREGLGRYCWLLWHSLISLPVGDSSIRRGQ